MDSQLADLVKATNPQFNQAIIDGLATQEIPFARRYLDRIWRCAETGFPPGLTYIRIERCTPQEEHAEIIKKKSSKSFFELAQSDVYMVRSLFKFEDEELPPRYLFLPFVRDAGILKLRGATFAISPVLANPVIDVQENGVFVPLNRAKLTFEKEFHFFLRDRKQEDVPVVWSEVHNLSKKARRMRGKPTIQCHHAMAHYLFAKYGLTETFQRFAGAQVQLGYGEPPADLTRSGWTVCQSRKIKPKGVRTKFYRPTDIWLAVPADKWDNLTSGLVGGFFYVADHFPEIISVEEVDEVRMWRIALGHAIFATNVSVGKLVEDVEAHLKSIDEYIDRMAYEEFQREGLEIHDIYQLYIYMIATLPDLVVRGGEDGASMYGKRLSVLRFVLFDVIKSIFNFMFKLNSNSKKVLSKNDIINAMNKHLKTECIFGLSTGHPEVASVSYPGDNKFLKITSNMVLQNENTRGTSKKANLSDAKKQLRFSIAEVGQYSNLPKSDPTGRSRVNSYLQLGPEGEVLKNPAHDEIRDEVQPLIRR